MESTANMKAIVFKGPGERSWESVPVPKLTEPTDALGKITETTICPP